MSIHSTLFTTRIKQTIIKTTEHNNKVRIPPRQLCVLRKNHYDIHVTPCQLIMFFYPRDAMLARVFATATCLSVRLSVRPSVTRQYCAYQSESRIVKCTPSDSPMTLVSGKVGLVEKFARGHPQKWCQMRGFWFFRRFSTCRHISKTVHFTQKVTMGR